MMLLKDHDSRPIDREPGGSSLAGKVTFCHLLEMKIFH